MVMGDKSEVVVVTYRQTATSLTIYNYSTNRPNPNKRDHNEEIVDTVRNVVLNQRGITMPAIDILCLCLEACSRKIKERAWKASKDFDVVEFE